MKITIIGTGFVGVVTAAVYASFGHQITGLDVDESKIAKLRESQVPFYEPNLETLLAEQQRAGRLSFTTDYTAAISDAEIVILAVGTPSAPDGQADLKYIFAAAESLAPHLRENAIVVIKSTVPPGTLEKTKAVIAPKTNVKFELAALPEFLREGSAVNDTLHPDRIIIGASSARVFETLEELHRPLHAEVIKITPESAQMAKYAANAYLATRITFINQMADLCEKNGADVQEIIQAIGLDKRIGGHYWYPGFGYGGSCFPKDVKELAAYSRAVGEADNLFNKVSELNENRMNRLMEHFGQEVGGWQGKKVAILGLAFKPDTDDMREAPALKIVPYLTQHQAQVTGFDPRARWQESFGQLEQRDSIEATCREADVILAVVEWPEIISFNYQAVRQATKPQWIIDGRNQLNPQEVTSQGFTYIGVGRSARPQTV